MRAGDLRHRIKIQRLTAAADGQGGQGQSPTTLIDRYPAQVLPAGARDRERMAGNALTASLLSLVRMRYRSGISVKDRIVFDGRTLQIENLQNPDGKKIELHALCSEVLS